MYGQFVSPIRHSERPRVLLVAPYFLPAHYGGAVQVYHQLLTRVRSLAPVILSQRLGGQIAEMEKFDLSCRSNYGYEMRRIERFDLVFRSDSRLMERVLDSVRFFNMTRRHWRRTIREVQPDIVICGATLAAGWLMSRIPGSIPFINYLHGEELAIGGESRLVRPYLFKNQLKAIRNADLNISVSRYTANRAADLAGIAKEQISLLPNFVDMNRFSPRADRDQLRQQLGWATRKVILTLARLTKRKGIDQAVRALAGLRREGKLSSDWLHVIAGTGEQEKELRDLVDRLGANNYTCFAGFVDESRVPMFYGAADIFLQTNRNLSGDTEGFGVVFLEASASGTPVIGGIAGGTADAIREGITGFRVDSEDLSAIGKAVLELVENSDLRDKMGKAGVEIVSREHRVEAAVSKFEGLVQGVLNARVNFQAPVHSGNRSYGSTN
jgi:phosphatidylinositol alpha-1,6-mannosyltransferase